MINNKKNIFSDRYIKKFQVRDDKIYKYFARNCEVTMNRLKYIGFINL